MNSNNHDYNSVSVVIVNYNAGVLLTECVRAGLQQATEVVVVDNASSDGSIEALAEQFPSEGRLKMICSDSNPGFAAGCNLGVGSTTGSYILFLNPDCILKPGALQRMVEVIEANSAAGMVGGLLINPDGTEQIGGGVPCRRHGCLSSAPLACRILVKDIPGSSRISCCINNLCRTDPWRWKPFPALACW